MASGDTIAVRVFRASPQAAAAAEDAQRGDELELAVRTDALRGAATVAERTERPAIARDALMALGDVLLSDLRFKARDRADYLKYLASSGKKVTQAVWDAQKAFLDAQYGEATHAESPLPPILTIDDDSLA